MFAASNPVLWQFCVCLRAVLLLFLRVVVYFSAGVYKQRCFCICLWSFVYFFLSFAGFLLSFMCCLTGFACCLRAFMHFLGSFMYFLQSFLCCLRAFMYCLLSFVCSLIHWVCSLEEVSKVLNLFQIKNFLLSVFWHELQIYASEGIPALAMGLKFKVFGANVHLLPLVYSSVHLLPAISKQVPLCKGGARGIGFYHFG